MPSAAPVLVVDDLSVSAPGSTRLVLDSVSLRVAAGETLGIVGESGSGKTTLARRLMRQERPLNIIGGAIRFAGDDLAQASMRTMRALRGLRIALVEQDPIATFDPLFTVGDQITEFVVSHRDVIVDASAVAPAAALGVSLNRLQAFGVRDTTWPHQWSRGMLQRALLALATAPAPDLLVLDEPTAALDAPVADRLVAGIARLARARGLATVLITRDLGFSATTCGRILVLRDGVPVETGETKVLLEDARTDYARARARARALVASAAWRPSRCSR